jgi:hypothetical protein
MKYEINIAARRFGTRTWLWAAAFNALLFSFFFYISIPATAIMGFLLIFITSLVLSLPAAVVMIFLLIALLTGNMGFQRLFLVLLLAGALLAAGVFFFFCTLVGGWHSPESWPLALLPAGSVAATCLLQHKSLQKICAERDAWVLDMKEIGRHAKELEL